MDRIDKILSTELFKGSQLSNFQLSINLNGSSRILPLGDINKVVGEYDRYVKERNDSNCYRIYGVLKGVFTNVLFNVTGSASYENILRLSGTTRKDEIQNFGYKDILIEIDGWFGYFFENPCTFECNFNKLRPKPNSFYFHPVISELNGINNPISNWVFKLTYPYTATTNQIGFFFNMGTSPVFTLINDGIAVTSIGAGNIDGEELMYIDSPINHGLVEGDQIKLFGFPLISSGAGSLTILNDRDTFNIVRVENETRFWIDYYDSNITPITINLLSSLLAGPIRFKRVIDGNESIYYFRLFKTLTELYDYDLYPAGFSNNIYNDPNQLYNFVKDIDTTGIVDYLGRPLTDIFLTKIKSTGSTNTEEWTNIGAGLLTNEPNINYDIRAISGGTSTKLLSAGLKVISSLIGGTGVVTINDTIFAGDIVDYNTSDISERMLTSVQYRFNSKNRENNDYGEGYFYNAHDRIKLLDYSSQVESEDSTRPTVGIPSYAIEVSGVTQWRDLLDKGIFDLDNGVDQPFLNGCTYIFTQHELCLKRQNPFQNLEYSGSVRNFWLIGERCNDINIFSDVDATIDGKC